MQSAAKSFIGTHDFTAFCSTDMREKNNMIRTIYNFDIKKSENIIEFVVTANGFLYNMVRIMIGTLLKINCGKIQSNSISDIIKSKDRSRAGDTVPSCGLYLNKVFY
jgi:tRNA pseudouridine38-40 synthase